MKVEFDLEEVQAMAHAVIDRLLELDGLSKADRAAHFASLAERALDGLPANAHVDALRGLARYAVERDH